jgi:hypothetical protein
MTARGRNRVADYVDAVREKDRLNCPASDYLQFIRYDAQGWRATFYSEGIAHSATAAVGSAWEREPWTAVQRAAWESLRKREAEAA